MPTITSKVVTTSETASTLIGGSLGAVAMAAILGPRWGFVKLSPAQARYAGPHMAVTAQRVVTEVVYVRIPVGLKIALEDVAAGYGVSLAFAVSRAIECYLRDRCDVELPDVKRPLP